MQIRAIGKGVYTNTTAPLNETKSASNTTVNTVAFRYTNTSLPTTGYDVLTVDYYDDYAYTGAPTAFTTVLNDASQAVYYNNTSLKPKGLLTGSWKRFIEASNTLPVRYELSHVLYDKKARPVRARTVNYMGGYTQLDSKIDFAGKVLLTETKHKRLNADPTEIYVKEVFTYSAQDRLLTHTHQIGTAGTPQVLTQNSYTELGRLISKKVGNTLSSPLQKVDYSYNIRGWLTAINNTDNLTQSADPVDLFAFKINYNSAITNNENNTIIPLYNGNIAETTWLTNTDNVLRRYGYSYDNLNRLKKAVYQKNGGVTNSYNESMTYDKNGNIMTMLRNGDFDDLTTTFEMDNLTYKYDVNDTTNRLMRVTDATNSTLGFKDDSNGTNDADDYGYDANGSMTRDDNKGIASIKYNHLNQPTEIVFSGTPTKKINYLYTASGEKQQKIVTNGTAIATTDYLGGFQYLKPTSSGAIALQYFPHAEGYVSNTVISGNNTYNYVFNYTDHLGNIRLTYTKFKTELKILEENHYYPFGLKHNNYNIDQAYYDNCFLTGGSCIVSVTRSPFQYKFNGQENQDELGLNVTAMDFRQYDTAIGRFNGIDLLAENSMEMTPYHFGRNNPNYWADPSGLDPLNSGAAWLDEMWDQTAHGTNSFWVNNDDFFQQYHYFDGVTPGSGTPTGFNVNYDGSTFSFPTDSYVIYDGDHGQNGNMGGRLDTVVIVTHRPKRVSSGNEFDFIKFNNNLSAFGIGWGMKELIIQGAVADARGMSMVNVNNTSYLRTLGAGGANYMKLTSRISKGANILGAGATLADGFENGFKAHHAADLGIQASIYAISASVPVAGWVVGGLYFVGDLYFQNTHNGQSITEYYLDN